MDQRRLLFTGATGFLGSRILPRLRQAYECIGVGGTRAHPTGGRLDLTDEAAVELTVRNIAPDIIVHAAAMTNVDACERDAAAAWRSNVVATANLVRAVGRTARPAALVHISSDQVYNGHGPNPEHSANPVNVYALTKLWAEDWALRAEHALVLRTNFVGLDNDIRAGFAGWLLSALSQGQAITLFDDVLFNPLHIDHLADLMVELIEARRTGRLNLGGSGDGMSKAQFGLNLARTLGLSTATVRVGSVEDVKLAARRPRDMRMATTRLQTVLGRAPEPVHAAIARVAAEWGQRTAATSAVGTE